MPEGDVKLLVENTVMKSSDKFKEAVTVMLKINQAETKEMVKEIHDAYVRNLDDTTEKAKEAKKLAGQAHDRIDELDLKISKIWLKVTGAFGIVAGFGAAVMYVIDQVRR